MNEVPAPTSEELEYIRSRSLAETFAGWNAIQQAIYLAVFRGHTRHPTVAHYLGLDTSVVQAESLGMYGDLLWDQSQPEPKIHLRD
ncbi:MAG TPA: hypothetical protein PKD86_18640 [Gemmatales bacterium]|nr:hypothetical protein [Gemmatales bacterium]HMP61363.1 hypothetical protein [Gemmatales bacterium]